MKLSNKEQFFEEYLKALKSLNNEIYDFQNSRNINDWRDVLFPEETKTFKSFYNRYKDFWKEDHLIKLFDLDPANEEELEQVKFIIDFYLN